MWKNPILVLAAFVVAPHLGYGQETTTVLDGVRKAMGEVKSIQYSGSGAFFALGQSFAPGEPWPRFGLKSFLTNSPPCSPDLLRGCSSSLNLPALSWAAGAPGF